MKGSTKIWVVDVSDCEVDERGRLVGEPTFKQRMVRLDELPPAEQEFIQRSLEALPKSWWRRFVDCLKRMQLGNGGA
jgi:hypothetical protein